MNVICNEHLARWFVVNVRHPDTEVIFQPVSLLLQRGGVGQQPRCAVRRQTSFAAGRAHKLGRARRLLCQRHVRCDDERFWLLLLVIIDNNKRLSQKSVNIGMIMALDVRASVRPRRGSRVVWLARRCAVWRRNYCRGQR